MAAEASPPRHGEYGEGSHLLDWARTPWETNRKCWKILLAFFVYNVYNILYTKY